MMADFIDYTALGTHKEGVPFGEIAFSLNFQGTLAYKIRGAIVPYFLEEGILMPKYLELMTLTDGEIMPYEPEGLERTVLEVATDGVLKQIGQDDKFTVVRESSSRSRVGMLHKIKGYFSTDLMDKIQENKYFVRKSGRVTIPQSVRGKLPPCDGEGLGASYRGTGGWRVPLK